jgi:hypothetical protein
MANGHGGKRDGAGAKKGAANCLTVDKIRLRQAARDYLGPHMLDVLAAQLATAKGLSYLVVRDRATGKFLRVGKGSAEKLNPAEEIIEIWETTPSTESAKVLLDRLLDKPSEHVELTGADGAPLEVRWKD